MTRVFPSSPRRESAAHISSSLTDFPDLLKKMYHIAWEAPEDASSLLKF